VGRWPESHNAVLPGTQRTCSESKAFGSLQRIDTFVDIYLAKLLLNLAVTNVFCHLRSCTCMTKDIRCSHTLVIYVVQTSTVDSGSQRLSTDH
jgi:hypothetical protein